MNEYDFFAELFEHAKAELMRREGKHETQRMDCAIERDAAIIAGRTIQEYNRLLNTAV